MLTRSIRELLSGRPVVSVTPRATLHEASDLIEAQAEAAVVVAQRGQVHGIITEHDILRHVSQRGGYYTTHVEQVMTRNVEVVETRGSVVDALVKMQSGGFRHIPVVDMGQKVVGMLSIEDIPAEYRMMRDTYVNWRNQPSAA